MDITFQGLLYGLGFWTAAVLVLAVLAVIVIMVLFVSYLTNRKEKSGKNVSRSVYTEERE